VPDLVTRPFGSNRTPLKDPAPPGALSRPGEGGAGIPAVKTPAVSPQKAATGAAMPPAAGEAASVQPPITYGPAAGPRQARKGGSSSETLYPLGYAARHQAQPPPDRLPLPPVAASPGRPTGLWACWAGCSLPAMDARAPECA
jgi:hypothetical protein